MTQNISQKVVNSFIKGLITEASGLTFPEDASVDELNCDLLKDGSRRRRLGIDFEDDYVYDYVKANPNVAISTHLWENVGEDADLTYIALQVGSNMFFYKLEDDTALSDSKVPLVVQLWRFERSGGAGVETVPVQTTNIRGRLVIASPEMDTVIVTLNESKDGIGVTNFPIRTRDFEWQGSRSSYGKTIDETTMESGDYEDRLYDYINCGWRGLRPDALPQSYDAFLRVLNVDKNEAAITSWTEDPGVNKAVFFVGDLTAKRAFRAVEANTSLLAYRDETGNYPAFQQPWYISKDSNDNFEADKFDKRSVGSGTSLITNGSIIMSIYYKDRQNVGGLSTDEFDTSEEARPSAVATYAGRVWYGGFSKSTDGNGSKIFFSQLLGDDMSKIGDCYQVNDPTSEFSSDLLDTDGGYVNIVEAVGIQKLHVFGAQLLVFAENGVWSISGVDDVFRATEYSVAKLSESGLNFPTSFISAETRPYWWSDAGIHTLNYDRDLGITKEVNLSIGSIQSFWDDIGATAKDRVRGIFDPSRRRIMWLYPDDDETTFNKLQNVLILDENLGAFFPWRFSDGTGDEVDIIGVTYQKGSGSTEEAVIVFDNDGNIVTNSSGATVYTAPLGVRDTFDTGLKYFVVNRDNSNYVTVATLNDVTFKDWGESDASCYVETGYDFKGDLVLQKNSPYVTVYCKTTEEGFVATTGGYEAIRPSSLKVSSYWDFKSSPSASPQEAYRLKHPPAPSGSTWDYPSTVVTTRLKLRGRGRSARLKFEAQEGYDFHLLGWGIVDAANTRY